MLIYTFIICHLIPFVFNTNTHKDHTLDAPPNNQTHTPTEYEIKLKNTVEGFFTMYAHPKSGIENLKGIKNNKNYTPRVDFYTNFTLIQKLTNNLQFIFAYLKNYKLIQKKTNKQFYDIDVRINITLTKYERTTCLHIPRYLDFIYTCTDEIDLYSKLLSLYSMLCVTWEQLTVDLQSFDMDKDSYTHRKKKVIDSFNDLLNTNVFENEYQYVNNVNITNPLIQYLETMHTIINYIDKTQMIQVRKHYNENMITSVENVLQYSMNNELSSNSSYKDSFYELTMATFNKESCKNQETNDVGCSNKMLQHSNPSPFTKKPYVTLNSNTNNKELLNQKLQMINSQYINSMKNCNTTKLPQDTTHDIPNLTYLLMVYTFKIFGRMFKAQSMCHIHKDMYQNTIEDYINQEDIQKFMKTIFNDFCPYVPTILFFLKNYDTELINLYLMFCNDNMDLIVSHCPSKDTSNSYNKLYSLPCIKYSLNDKYLVNYYSLTKQILESDRSVTKNVCTKHMNNFIHGVYYTIISIYNYDYDFTPIWTTFNWLSGKYFLTEEYINDEMNEIKNNTIQIYGQKMTLSEFYYILLPWKLNVENVMILHNAVLYHLYKTMSTYFYRNIKLIIMYFKHHNTEMVNSPSLLRTLNWYNIVTQPFNKYLCLTGTCKPHPNIDKIKSMFKIKGKKPGLIDDIQKEIPNLDSWIENIDDLKKIKTNKKPTQTYADILLKVAKMNCKHAESYVTVFIFNVSKLMKSKNEINIPILECSDDDFEFFSK